MLLHPTVGADPRVCPRICCLWACSSFVIVRADTGVCPYGWRLFQPFLTFLRSALPLSERSGERTFLNFSQPFSTFLNLSQPFSARLCRFRSEAEKEPFSTFLNLSYRYNTASLPMLNSRSSTERFGRKPFFWPNTCQ